MLKVTVKNTAGKDVKDIELKESLFALPSNDTLVHQVYVALTANQRVAIAHTKDRSERSGSGIKPWRQKGTGRARAGATRSPIWRKGGITFGPTKDRNFSKDTNRKMRQKATLIALSEKIRAGKLIIIDTLDYSEKKTKLFAATLKGLGIAERSVAIGFSADEYALGTMVRNIPKAEYTLTDNLNVMQLMDREYLILSEASIKNLEVRFSQWDKAPVK